MKRFWAKNRSMKL